MYHYRGTWQGTEGRHSAEPEKAHLTGEFVMVMKFVGNVLHRLALNVVRQTKISVYRQLFFFNLVFGIW